MGNEEQTAFSTTNFRMLFEKKTLIPNQDEKTEIQDGIQFEQTKLNDGFPVLDRFVFHKLSCRWPYSVLLDVNSKKPAHFPQWFLHE